MKTEKMTYEIRSLRELTKIMKEHPEAVIFSVTLEEAKKNGDD